jgi:mono/diheme cytochrome c family protein
MPGLVMRRGGLRLLIAGCILALAVQRSLLGAGAHRLSPQGPGDQGPSLRGATGPSAISDSIRSTRSGAYSAAQAGRGVEIYALNCVSCHTAISHTGPAFVDKWEGRSLWELYQFVSESMPKSEPGSLSPGEYTRVLAYMLQMNGAPAGPDDLVSDSTVLKKIRIELKSR